MRHMAFRLKLRHTAAVPAQRFAVYRNNVMASLVKALQTALSRDRKAGRRGILCRDGAGIRDGASTTLAAACELRRRIRQTSSPHSNRRGSCPIWPTWQDSRRRAPAPIMRKTPRRCTPMPSRRSLPTRSAELRIASASLGRHRALAVSDRDDLGDEQRRAAALARSRIGAARTRWSPGRFSTWKCARCRRAARRSCGRSRRLAARRRGGGRACRPRRFRPHRQSRRADRLGHRPRHRIATGEAIMTAVSKPLPARRDRRSCRCGSVQRAIAALDRIPYWLIALAARIFPAAVFWQSGQTKVAGCQLEAQRHRAVRQRVSAAADRSRGRRVCSRGRRAPVPDSAGDRTGVAIFGDGAAGHDHGDRDLRLPRRLADSRRMGGLLSGGDRARTGRCCRWTI